MRRSTEHSRRKPRKAVQPLAPRGRPRPGGQFLDDGKRELLEALQLVLDLADKLDEIGGEPLSAGPRPDGAGADDAIRALVSLGYTLAEAEKAVRAALDSNGRAQSATELIRNALAKVRG